MVKLLSMIAVPDAPAKAFISLLMIAALCTSGCGKGSSDPQLSKSPQALIVGKWECEGDPQGLTRGLEFIDQTHVVFVDKAIQLAGTYKLLDDKTLETETNAFGPKTTTFQVDVSDDTLIVAPTEGKNQKAVSYNRVKDFSAALTKPRIEDSEFSPKKPAQGGSVEIQQVIVGPAQSPWYTYKGTVKLKRRDYEGDIRIRFEGDPKEKHDVVKLPRKLVIVAGANECKFELYALIREAWFQYKFAVIAEGDGIQSVRKECAVMVGERPVPTKKSDLPQESKETSKKEDGEGEAGKKPR